MCSTVLHHCVDDGPVMAGGPGARAKALRADCQRARSNRLIVLIYTPWTYIVPKLPPSGGLRRPLAWSGTARPCRHAHSHLTPDILNGGFSPNAFANPGFKSIPAPFVILALCGIVSLSSPTTVFPLYVTATF